MNLLLGESADEFRSRHNVAPLVLTTHFEFAAELLVEHIKIIRLKDHIVELKEGKPRFKAHFDGFRSQHFVDAELGADIAQEIEVEHIVEPLRVVHENGVVFGDEAGELLADALRIVCNDFFGENHARLALAGGIADLPGCAADHDDGNMPRLLKTAHRHDREKMSDMKTVAGGVESHIIIDLFLREKFLDCIFGSVLVNEPPDFQILKWARRHFCNLSSMFFVLS